MKNNPTKSSKAATDKTVKGPKALFWFLTLFFTLAITAFNIGGLWFQYINKWLPKEVAYGLVRTSFNQTALKFNLASLLVATPLFFWLGYLIRKALKNNNLDPKNKIRVWITYIILFLTIATAVGDLITTVFRVLDGDYTARFLLKALTILLIVSWIFTYYWFEIRSPHSLVGSKIPKIMAVVPIVVITISFVGSFFIVDSPALARLKAYDRTRTSNLQEIKYATDDYYREFNKLPESLTELKTYRAYIQITDPKSEETYEYQIIDEVSYELCADFETSNKEGETLTEYGYEEFLHDAGRNCFKRKVSQLEKEVMSPLRVAPISD